MSKSDVNLVWFQTTAGHHGRKDLYLKTLNNLKKNINLDYFDNKFLSLKVFNNDEFSEVAAKFEGFDLFLWKKKDGRINDESPYKDYGYYLLSNYLSDIACCYEQIKMMGNYSKYTYLVEDDSPEILNRPLEELIQAAKEKLESDPNLFSVHLQREGYLKDDPKYLTEEDPHFNYLSSVGHVFTPAHDYNFQNQIFRTEDMIKVSEYILNNYTTLVPIHTERAVRIAIWNVFPKAYFVSFDKKLGHSIHIGVSDADKWIESYKL